MGRPIEEKLDAWEAGFTQKVQKLLTPKRAAVILMACYAISLIPLLWIAKYNYPSADDYTNGSRCYHVWEASHSVIKVIGEAISRTADEWLTWRGCFTSSFLSALPPSIFGERLYGLTAWIVLLTLSFATVYFFYEVLVKGFKADKYTSYSIAALVLFITVQCMGEAGRAEAFYWYSGAINYVFIHSLSLIFYGLLISAACSDGRKRKLRLALSSIFGFLVAGGNQMTMLNVAIVLVTVMIFMTVQRKWKNNKGLLIPIAVFFVGFILAVVAPGNLVRAGSSHGMNPVKAIMVSFYYGLDLMLSQWTTWPVILLAICMVPPFWHMAAQTKFRFRYPLPVVLFGYCIVSAMVTPPLFILGNIEAGRLQALMFLMYGLVLALCVGYVTGWARKRYEGNRERIFGERENIAEDAQKQYEANGCILLVGCLVFLLVGSILTFIPDRHCYTAASAITDLMNGTAAKYGKEQEERTREYRSKQEGTLIVEPFSAPPSLLFFSDIAQDPEDWTNLGVCRYYGLDSVAVRKKS